MADIVITPASNDVNSTAGTLVIRTSDAQAMSLKTNDTDRIFIASAGKVGIGTAANISGVLHVHSPDAGNQTLLVLHHSAGYSTNTENRLDFFDDEAHKIAARISQYYSAETNNRWGLKFYTNSDTAINSIPALTLLGRNAVGIGTANPNGMFHVHCTQNGSGEVYFTSNTGNTNQNNDSPKLILAGEYQTAGVSLQAVNTAAYGRKDLVILQHDANDYVTAYEAMRLSYGGTLTLNTTTKDINVLSLVSPSSATLSNNVVLDISRGGGAHKGSAIRVTSANYTDSNKQAFIELNAAAYGGANTRFINCFDDSRQSFVVLANARVGIGTASPGAALEVSGSAIIGSSTYGASYGHSLRIPFSSDNLTAGTLRGHLQFDSIEDYSVNAGDAWRWKLGAVARPGNAGNYNSQFEILRSTRVGVTDNPDFVINRDGNVGIGMISPTNKIQISGGGISFTTSTGLAVPMIGIVLPTNIAFIGPYNSPADGNSPTVVALNHARSVQQTWFYASGNIAMVLNKEGRLHIGNNNNAPNCLLSVGPSSSTTAVSGMCFGNDASANLYRGTAGQIKTDGQLLAVGGFYSASTVGNYIETLNIGTAVIIEGGAGEGLFLGDSSRWMIGTSDAAYAANDDGDLHFRDNTNSVTRMIINYASGFVGIGTTAPYTRLDVRGGVLRTNTRVSNTQLYPLGHYSAGEPIFEVDPSWSEVELQRYFNSSNVSWAAVADAPGGYCIYINGAVEVGAFNGSGFPYIPVDTDDIFYMECWIQNVGSNQTHYMGSQDLDHNFSNLGGNPGSYGYFVMVNTNPTATWTKVSGYIGGFSATVTGKFEIGTKYWSPMALFNYTAGTGTRACRISGWKVIKVYQPGNRYFSGNIGIGTTSPTQKLDIVGSYGAPDDDGGMLKIRGPGVGPTQLNFGVSADGGYGWIQATDIAVDDDRDIILGPLGGKVGIGTTSPSTLLNVHGTNPFVRINNTSADDHGIKISYNNSETHGLNLIYNANSAVSSIDNTYQVVTAQVYGDIRFRQNVAGTMTTRMTIKGDGGNVGIGTTNPIAKLHVSWGTDGQSVKMLGAGGSTNGNFIYSLASDWSDTFGLNVFATAHVNSTARTNNLVRIHSNETSNGSLPLRVTAQGSIASPTYEALAVNYLGNVGIGTIAPTGKLTIQQNSDQLRLQTENAPGSFYTNISSLYDSSHPFSISVANNSSSTAEYFAVYADAGGANNRIALLNGNVGIGITTNPIEKLHVLGSVHIQSESDSIGGAGLYLGDSNNRNLTIRQTSTNKNFAFDTYNATDSWKNRITILNNGGNVGIGTDTPLAPLHVGLGGDWPSSTGTSAMVFIKQKSSNVGLVIQEPGNASFDRALHLYTNASLATIDATYRDTGPYPDIAFVTSGTERVRINSAGNVLIRTTTSTTNGGLLQIGQVPNTTASSIGFNNDDNAVISAKYNLVFQIDNTNSVASRSYEWNKGGKGYGDGTNLMTLNAAGKLGIGTASPTTLLSVGGAGSTLPVSGITFGADASANLYRAGSSAIRTDGALIVGSYIRGLSYIQLLTNIYADSYTDNLNINIGNTAANNWETAIKIKPGSYVGIGTTNPTGKLHIVSSVAGETVLRADGTNGILFSVNDDLSDSLMSVNNSAGLPVLEVFADDRVVAGQYGSGDFVLINNKIGLGTSNPANKLTVIGGASIGSTTYNTSAPSNGLIVEGNVGIGTTNPSYKLDVSASVTDVGRFYNNQSTLILNIGSTNNTVYTDLALLTDNGNAQFFKQSNSASWGGVNSLNIYTSNGAITFHPAGTQNAVYIASNGNVGIGSANPSEKLIVNGSIGFAGDLNRYLLMPDIYQGTGSIYIQAGFGSAAAGGAIKLHGHLATTYIGGDVEVGMSEKGDFLINTAIGGTRRVTVKNDGNVGIGTITPSGKLHINTASYSSLFRPLVVNNGVQAVNARLYDTAVIQQDDVTTLRLVERNSAVANQILSFSIGDGFARIACTAQPMQFYVNGGDGIGDYGYMGLNGTKAIEISTTADVGIGNVTPSAARLHIKGDGSNPVLRVESALLVAGTTTASKTFVGWMPMQTGALSPGDTVFIPLFK
jgi:hypothetical protein